MNRACALACLAGLGTNVAGCGKEPAKRPTRATDAGTPRADVRGHDGGRERSTAPDGSDAQPMALPPPMVVFDALLSELEQAPPTAARAKRTCAIPTNDKERGMLFAVWKVAPPSWVPGDEWKAATEDFANMEYEIGDLCQDLAWDDDVTVLAKLRARFERLVRLVNR